MSRRCTVYTLSDESGEVRYVGCTVSPLSVRLAQHFHDACAAKRIRIWVAREERAGRRIVADALYIVGDHATGTALERSTIAAFTASGVPLLNSQHIALRGTIGHVRLWSACGSYREFSSLIGEPTARRRTFLHARSIWLGWCPSVREADRLGELLGIDLDDWLVDGPLRSERRNYLRAA